MGGSSAWMQLFGGQTQQEPVAPPQYSNDQLLQYAQSQKGNYDQFKAYNNELVNQLRANTYQDPYKVWQSVRDSQFKPPQPELPQDAQPTDFGG